MYKVVLTLILALTGGASWLPATTITFGGSFSLDDDVVLLYYTQPETSLVTVSTTSFLGGGFLPILSLFSADGTFQFKDAPDITREASLTYNSIGGEFYIIALTQWGNNPIEPTLLDGFTQDGTGNYTADLPFNNSEPGGAFFLDGGGLASARTSAWTVEFNSVDPAFVVLPEPSTGFLYLGGGLLLAARIYSRKLKLN